MTSGNNIIFYTITAVIFVGIILCFILFHSSGQPSDSSETNEGNKSMIEILAPYAAIISAVAALYVGT